MQEISKDVLDKAKKIQVIVTDVDGVLTDSSLLVDSNGNELAGRFNILDGFATTIAKDCGLKIIVISGRKSLSTEARFRNLGIDDTYTGVNDKRKKLTEVIDSLDLDMSVVAYMGDDLIDLGAMGLAGLKIAPQNAVEVVRQYADYITSVRGGDGTLREVVELILKAQNRYAGYIKKYYL